MDLDDPLQRLRVLQRDLTAFAEARLPNVARLAAELDDSLEDLKRLLEKKRKNEASRNALAPNTTPKPETVKIQDVDYAVNDDFREAALMVADELDLDELEAAKLCIDASHADVSEVDRTLPYRALLRFHDHRNTLLECLRLVLQQRDNLEDLDEDNRPYFIERVDALVKSSGGGVAGFWKKCIAGLADIEGALQKVSDHVQTMYMTGVGFEGDIIEAMHAQRLLLTRQHESLTGVMSILFRLDFLSEVEFREFMSKAATLEASLDITIHYLPIILSASTSFGFDESTPASTSHGLHKLFAAGPAQQQWKQSDFKAAATVCWLAEYSSRFSDPHADPRLAVADRQSAERERSDLFMQAVRDKAFHLLLTACKFVKPEVWHDPAKLGLVGFLLADSRTVLEDAPPASPSFATLLTAELQGFTNAFVGNLPDVVRRLKSEEDDQRRLQFSQQQPSEGSNYEPDLERFMVIMAYAFQDDPEAAQDFWLDRESTLYGFLRWVSQRLPTPRVAAFCELLRSIASDSRSANHAHRFLLEDTTMVSGRLRKTYSVSWTQIFAELDTYATSLQSRPAAQQLTAQEGGVGGIEYVEGVETGIMLEAYLRLAAHICRTSSDARRWLLQEQTFHLPDNMFSLAASGIEGRIQASCFNVLSAMLTHKITEVNDGTWVMLDNWIAGGGLVGSGGAQPQTSKRPPVSERHYLQRFNDRPETATAFVALLNALVTPSVAHAEPTLDMLPFPETLGAPHRHAGIDAYVDFAVGTVFKLSENHVHSGSDATEISVLRYTSLRFMYECLSTFNEDLVLLANVSNIGVDSAIRTSSLAVYARIHPFARTMEWLFNDNVIAVLFAVLPQSADVLNDLHINSPQLKATLTAIQVMNLAMKLQATYFDIVRPIVKTQSASRSSTVANPALASFDDVMLSQLSAVVDIARLTACTHAELSMEALQLLQKLSSSRKISESVELGSGRVRVGNRLIGVLAEVSEALAVELAQDFLIYEFDIETGDVPLKLVKAQAVLDLLNGSLDASASRPTVAHTLLGFHSNERTVTVAPDSAFAYGRSLFHTIAACAAQAPIAVAPTSLSWLLGLKRGCFDVLLKLALSPLTAGVVRVELRTMEFLDAASKNQVLATMNPLWDSLPWDDPNMLLNSSAPAIRDFVRVRELFFQYVALELRTAAEMRAYSVQERAVSTLRGLIRYPSGEQESTLSVFDLFDFLDMEVPAASEVAPKYLTDVDLSVCTKDDPEITTAFDLKMAEEMFVLRKREILVNGRIKDAAEELSLDNEIRATLASLVSQNNWRAIQAARVAALEAWTDLTSLIITSSGLVDAELANLALQALQVILPKFEKSLSGNLEAAALLAKLTLGLVPAAISSLGRPLHQTANAAHERLLSAFRVCLKTITDSGTDLALRDVCYRTCYAIINAMPLKLLTGKPTPSAHTKQLLQLVHIAGDRLVTVITEDAFSGRGSTRVSGILFLDALVALFQAARVNAAILRALSKLNFIPVLIDTSIGNVAASFQGEGDELLTTLAYFHTALALLLRVCRTADGAQLLLNSGFFEAISESRLFSTDPDIGLDIDNPTALREFYKLLSAVLRVVTAVVVGRGPSNTATVQQAKTFLQQNRFSMQAVFKRTSAVQRTAGPPEPEAVEVAEAFGKLMLVTGFLEDDESAHLRASRANGFS